MRNAPGKMLVLAGLVVLVALVLQAPDASSSSGVPSVPSFLTVYHEFCYEINTAEWASSSGATFYELYRSASSSFTNQTLEYSGANTFDVVYTTSTAYLRVRACNSQGCSGYRVGNQPAKFFYGCL